jgi:hypothetical protein
MQGRGLDEAGDGETDDSGSVMDGDTKYGADDNIDGGFEDDVAMLRGYCLIVVDEAGDEFEMHGLVQLSTRRWLEAFGKQETFKQQCIERMAASFPTGRYENWATCRSLFAHAQVALGYRPSEDTLGTSKDLSGASLPVRVRGLGRPEAPQSLDSGSTSSAPSHPLVSHRRKFGRTSSANAHVRLRLREAAVIWSPYL